MQTITKISDYNQEHQTALTIGTFDGVHIGHQKIIKQLTDVANENQLKSTLLSFFPHPRMVLQKDSGIQLLNTLDEKILILKKLGLHNFIVHPFTQEFSRYTATEFVRDQLVNNLKMKKIIIGYDHRFGRNRTANINDLKIFGATYDFTVDEISAQEIDHVSVSSTKIRTALLDGDIETANTYLGYPYMLTGTVVEGKKIGQQLGYPTANISIAESYKLIPKNGVYVIKSTFKNKTVYGMMNIGYNPTVDQENTLPLKPEKRIEVHFFNFNSDLYNQKIQVDILHRLRNEQKFESLNALKKQLQLDQITSLKLIERSYN